MTQTPPMLALDARRLDELIDAARRSPRRRLNLNLHPTMDEPIHRLAIAMEPDSYVRPHRHPARWELLIVVRGRFDVSTFDDDARLTGRIRLAAGETAALQYPAGTWHTLVALDSGSVFFEVKEGPYLPVDAADWLPGAPAEGASTVPAFLQRLAVMRIGERI
ncbi:MAG: WbuC family cupin fold metalloprotein [Burkholderiaceae bacterium]